MARLLNVALLGCASHKFNLAVRCWIAEQPELSPIIAKVGARFAVMINVDVLALPSSFCCCSNNTVSCPVTKQVS
jgi:hypothetical protein